MRGLKGELMRMGIALVATTTACHKAASAHETALIISDAYLVAPAGNAPAAMYFTMQNVGATADTLTGIHVTGVASAQLHEEVMTHPAGQPTSPGVAPMSMATMIATPAISIPAHGTVRLAPGGRHIMLTGMQRPFVRGDSTSAALTFRHARVVKIPVWVIDYTQLDTLVHP